MVQAATVPARAARLRAEMLLAAMVQGERRQAAIASTVIVPTEKPESTPERRTQSPNAEPTLVPAIAAVAMPRMAASPRGSPRPAAP